MHTATHAQRHTQTLVHVDTSRVHRCTHTSWIQNPLRVCPRFCPGASLASPFPSLCISKEAAIILRTAVSVPEAPGDPKAHLAHGRCSCNASRSWNSLGGSRRPQMGSPIPHTLPLVKPHRTNPSSQRRGSLRWAFSIWDRALCPGRWRRGWEPPQAPGGRPPGPDSQIV